MRNCDFFNSGSQYGLCLYHKRNQEPSSNDKHPAQISKPEPSAKPGAATSPNACVPCLQLP